MKMVKEKRSEVMEKLKVPVEKNPKPIPQDIQTFDKIAKIFPESKRKKWRKGEPKDPYFGRAKRFRKPEIEKWKDRARRFNSHNSQGKSISIKNGPQPGPGRYNLIHKWKGKNVRSKKMKRSYSAAPKRGERVFDSISKGPSTSIYYPRRG